MRKALQVLVRRDAAKFLAECVEYPVVVESEFLDEALSGVERGIQRYLEERDSWDPEGLVLFVSVYFGRLGAG